MDGWLGEDLNDAHMMLSRVHQIHGTSKIDLYTRGSLSPPG